MALVICPDCQAQVSDAAPACPKCGRPAAGKANQPDQPKKRGVVWLVIITLAVIGAVVLYGANLGNRRQSAMQTALVMFPTGMTEDHVHTISRAIALERGVTRDEVEEVIYKMVCTGQISSELIEKSAGGFAVLGTRGQNVDALISAMAGLKGPPAASCSPWP